MHKDAVRHLTKAKDYLAKGEAFYRKAAEEIVAAKESEHTLSNREIGEWFGKGETWVTSIVRWSTSPRREEEPPFGGEAADASRKRHVTKKVLAEAPLEQVEQIMSDLPVARRAAIADALKQAGPQRGPDLMTEADEKAAEAAYERDVKEPVMRTLGALLSPHAYIDSALDTAKQLNESGGDISDFEACVETWAELGNELWVYGAKRGQDVSSISEAVKRWEDA